jgi:hypothetical protein
VLEAIRKKLNQSGRLGAGIAIVVVLGAVVLAFYAFRGAAGPSLAAQNASQQPFMCSETNKVFFHTLRGKIPDLFIVQRQEHRLSG